MKRTVVLAACTLLFFMGTSTTSCNSNKRQKQIDSIAIANKNLQAEVEEMDELISSVLNNFQEINAMEGMINVPENGELKSNQKERVQNNMKMIADKLKANKADIESLNAKLASLGAKNRVMSKTVKSLQLQLETKSKEIQRLNEELQRKNIALKDLDEAVTALNNSVEELGATNQVQAETIAAQDASLNTVRYCIGTKSDLKEMGILVNGKVATENYTNDYFTQVDLRKLSRIPLYSKKAELLTNHPASSYRLVKGNDKQLTLEILDAPLFWSLSKILVIKTA